MVTAFSFASDSGLFSKIHYMIALNPRVSVGPPRPSVQIPPQTQA